MFLAFVLILLGLVLAIRANRAANQAASQTRMLEARLRLIESELTRLKPPQAAAAVAADSAPVEPLSSTPRIGSIPMDERISALAPAPVAIVQPRPGDPSEPPPTLESEIGARWMLLAGIVVLVLGVAFFLKYAFDRDWINEWTRVGVGTIAGCAVWVAGLRFAQRDYVPFGRVIAGGGLAIAFVSAWAATALYGLVATEVGFAWVVAIAIIAAITADRHRSVGLALVAVVFAYAAPFIIPNDVDRPLILFSYEAILATAAFVLVRRHGWPALGLASWWATWTTFALWSGRSYRDAIFVPTEIYLAYVTAIFGAMMSTYRRQAGDFAKLAAWILSAGPLLFHIASVYILFPHSLWFLPYLIIGSAVCVGVAPYRAAVRLLGWVAVALPFIAWIDSRGTGGWYVPALVSAAAIYLVHLSCQLQNLRAAKTPGIAELLLFQINGLGSFLFAYLLVDANAGSTPLLAGWCAVWYLFLAWRFRSGWTAAVPHALAIAFTLIAGTIALALTGPWVTIAYAAEGVAAVVVGLRTARAFFRAMGAALVALACSRLVILQFGDTPAAFTAILNRRMLTGAFIVALLYGISWLYRRYGNGFAEERDRAVAAAIVAANVLTVGLLTADVNSFWVARPDQLTAEFSRQLSVSVTWGAYAMGAILVGFSRQSATLRYLALALFGVTVGKMFTVDLLALEGVYRITGFIALGLGLLGASFLYQRHSPKPSPRV